MPHSAGANDSLNVPQLSDTMDTATIYLQKSRWIKLIDVSTADSGHGTQLTAPHQLMAGQAAGKKEVESGQWSGEIGRPVSGVSTPPMWSEAKYWSHFIKLIWFDNKTRTST